MQCDTPPLTHHGRVRLLASQFSSCTPDVSHHDDRPPNIASLQSRLPPPPTPPKSLPPPSVKPPTMLTSKSVPPPLLPKPKLPVDRSPSITGAPCPTQLSPDYATYDYAARPVTPPVLYQSILCLSSPEPTSAPNQFRVITERPPRQPAVTAARTITKPTHQPPLPPVDNHKFTLSPLRSPNIEHSDDSDIYEDIDRPTTPTFASKYKRSVSVASWETASSDESNMSKGASSRSRSSDPRDNMQIHSPDCIEQPSRPPRPRRNERLSRMGRGSVRPMSQPSLEGLFRIKSDIKVGNIKMKITAVTSSEHLHLLKFASLRAKRKTRRPTDAPDDKPETSTMLTTSVHFPLHSQQSDYDWTAYDEWDSEDDSSVLSSTPVNLPDLISSINANDPPTESTTPTPELRSLTLQPSEDSTAIVSPPISPPCSPTELVASLEHIKLSEQHYSRLITEPLYQHLDINRPIKITRNESSSSGDASVVSRSSSRRDQFINVGHRGSQRSLWCELAEVIQSGLLNQLSNPEKKLQEAMFEVITSEASYLRSLNVLITHFVAAPEFSVIDRDDRKHLFSNILTVRDVSEKLLSRLETQMETSLQLHDVCVALCEHFEEDAGAYITYCSNQVFQDRTLKKLKKWNAAFVQSVQSLESASLCEGLDMRSFLTLPTQRITRFPLLIMAIVDRCDPQSIQATNAHRALSLANKIVGLCNEGARRMDRLEQLVHLESVLHYSKNCDLRRIPLISSSRYLIKQGKLLHIYRNESRRKSAISFASLTAQRGTRPVHLLLFTDMLFVTKPKSGLLYVKDYCTRAFVEMAPIEPDNTKLPPSALHDLPQHLYRHPHLLLLTLMQNGRGKHAEYILCADSETDRERWLNAMRPPCVGHLVIYAFVWQAANPEETIYAQWDCPQVQATHEYVAQQEDELGLQIGDIVNVLRRMDDGELVRDGHTGWFPSSYTRELLNDHVRARNYRQRLKLIQAAESIQQERETAQPTLRGTVAGQSGGRQTLIVQKLRRMSSPVTSLWNTSLSTSHS